MKKFHVFMSLFLAFTLLFSPISQVAFADTVSVAGIAAPSVIDKNLEKWILDEENGTIYALTQDTDKLLFIDMNTLVIKKEISLQYVSDIELYNGKLYAALESYKQVAVVNIKTGAVEKKISVKESPYKIALANNKIYYSLRYVSGIPQQADYTKVFAQNLDGTNHVEISPMGLISEFENTYYGYHVADIQSDPATNKLYISTTNTFNSYIMAISTKDNKLLDSCNTEGFETVLSNIVLNDNDVFFGKYRLDKNQLSKVNGRYDEIVMYARGDSVFTNSSIFDRTTFVKIGSFEQVGGYVKVLIDSKKDLYIYKGPSNPIIKDELSKFLNIKPVEAPGINYNADTSEIEAVAKRLDISQWLVNKEKNIIYALSKENNTLLFIGLDDLKVKKKIFIGKSPTNLQLSEGKLYVSLFDINQVAVVDVASQTVEKNIILKYRSSSLSIDGNKMFYMGYSATSQLLHEYNLLDESEKIIHINNAYSFRESDISIDKSNHVLYIGGLSGANAIAISTIDYKLMGVAKTKGTTMITNPVGLVSKSSNALIYSRFKIDSKTLASVYGYFEEPIIYTSGDYAFSKKAVYHVNNFEKVVDLPFETDQIYVDNNQIYLYNKTNRNIKKLSMTSLVGGFSVAYNSLVRNTDYSMEKDEPFNRGLKLRINKMLLNEKNGLLYAISENGYKLHIIGANDLKLKKEIIIGLGTSDIKLYHDKLYISASGTNYVTVVDTTTNKIIQKYHLSENPELIEIDGDKLFYIGNYKMHIYNMSTKIKKEIPFHDFVSGWDFNYMKSIFLDRDNHILYGNMGESNPTKGLFGIDMIREKAVQLPINANILNEVRDSGTTVFNDNEVFYAQNRYNRSDFSSKSQKYLGMMLHADDKYMISSYEMYTRATHIKLGDIHEYYDNMQVDKKGNAYIMLGRDQSIKKTSIHELLANLKNKTPAYEALKAKGEIGNPSDYMDNIKYDESAYPQPDIEENQVDEIVPTVITFNDIQNHWAKKDIEYLASKQIVKGIGDGNLFAPNNKITRAEFVSMLVRALDLKSGELAPSLFSDVKSTDWFYSSVMTANSLGLVKGKGNGSFSPNASITREEIATLSVRAMEYMNLSTSFEDNNILNTFTDNKNISSWAKSSAAISVNAGLITGTPTKQFAPLSMSTRAECVVILKRLLTKL